MWRARDENEDFFYIFRPPVMHLLPKRLPKAKTSYISASLSVVFVFIFGAINFLFFWHRLLAPL